MLADLKRTNPKQWQLVVDPAPHVAGLCPRRAGKSYGGAGAALITGEAKPGAISIIISLNLKQLRRLYWAGGASGLFTFDKKYALNLQFNSTYLRWEHENGSIGYLLGAEDAEQLEVIRGMEADLYLVDESQAFAPGRLIKLIDDIIDPQRSSRKGRLLLIGTPGQLAAGPFWEATDPRVREEAEIDGEKKMVATSVPYGEKDPHGQTPAGDLLWSRHHWTLQENTALPHQWEDALIKKRKKRWADDHPSWLREYLGQWTTSSEGLVFRYGLEKARGQCNWTPEKTKDNPTGLPKEGAPWRLVAGLDLGYEAPCALEVLAYSTRLREVRSVAGYSVRHLTPNEVGELCNSAIEEFGQFEKIYVDAGNLGKMVLKMLATEYGLPVEKADKREKNDHIEILNAGFVRGEVKIIEGTKLEEQLLTNAWDLGDGDKDTLARLGKLKENDSIPNDSTDAFLYAYRAAYHHFGQPDAAPEPERYSDEWWKAEEKRLLEQFRAQLKKADKEDARLGDNNFSRAPRFVANALRSRSQWIPTPTQSARTNSRQS